MIGVFAERRTNLIVSAAGPPVNLPALQGIYFLVTGIWPLLNRRSFERVTGRKEDFWLARTVGVLVAAIGSTVLTAERRGRITPEIELLAIASAGGLGLTESLFAAKGRISKVYLLDALVEGALIAAWTLRHRR